MDADEHLRILRDLIAIDSQNGNELAVATYLSNLLGRFGVKASVTTFGDRRANLVCDLGTGDQVLGLTGHMDTVAVGPTGVWTYPPLAATVVGDRVYGRGAADMKSGLAAQVIALIELATAGPLPGHVRWLATAGEENGTPGAKRLAKAGVAGDLAGLVVGEPTSGRVINAHSGSFNYRVTSRGRAVHSSTPEKGKNALAGVVDFALGERVLFDDVPKDPCLGPFKHAVTIIRGGDQVNTIPDEAELFGNLRPTGTFGIEQATACLTGLCDRLNRDGAELTLTLENAWAPVVTPPDSRLVQLALAASRAAFAALPDHPAPSLGIINGATDASVFIRERPGLPVVVLGPDAWASAHQVDEYTTISSFEATIAAYQDLIQRFFV